MVKLRFKTHRFVWWKTIIWIHLLCFFSWFGTPKSSKSLDHFSIDTLKPTVTLGPPILRDPQLLQPPLFCASHGISHGAVCLVALCLAPRRLVWASTRGAAGGAAGVEPKATRMGREGHGRPGAVNAWNIWKPWGFLWFLWGVHDVHGTLLGFPQVFQWWLNSSNKWVFCGWIDQQIPR